MDHSLERLRELSLAERLGRLYRLWGRVADQELLPLGLTYPRWTALWKLKRLGDHISQKSLADALEIEVASLMRTLGQLEEQGLVNRHCCSEDKRARIVSLTDAGLELLAQMEQRIMQARHDLLGNVDEAELARFELTLGKITDNALARLARHNQQGSQQDDT